MASLILAPTSPLWAIVPPSGGRTLFANSSDGGALYVKLPNGTYEKLDATYSVSGTCSPCGGGGGSATDCAAVANCIDTNTAVQTALASYLTSNGYSSLVFVNSVPTTPRSDSHIEINTTNGDIYTSDGVSVITNSWSAGGSGIQYATDPTSIGGRITFSVGVNADTIDEALIEYDSVTDTWNWNTVTQTGATTFDASYSATYTDGSTITGDVDYVNATIDHVNSTVNYDGTSTVNNNGNAINNTGNTITNTGVTENYDATSTVNNNGNAINNTNNTITNTGVTENYDATSTVNNNGNTIVNTGVTETYDSTSTVTINWTLVASGTSTYNWPLDVVKVGTDLNNSQPSSVVIDGGFAYVACTNSDEIVKVDLSTRTVDSTISSAFAEPYGLCVDAWFLYVTSDSVDQIEKINLGTFTSVGTTALTGTGSGGSTRPVSDGTYLYIGRPGNNSMDRVDISTFTLSSNLGSLLWWPVDVEIVWTKLYFSAADAFAAQKIGIIDISAGMTWPTFIASWDGTNINARWLSSDGTTLYAISKGWTWVDSQYIASIDTTTDTVTFYTWTGKPMDSSIVFGDYLYTVTSRTDTAVTYKEVEVYKYRKSDLAFVGKTPVSPENDAVGISSLNVVAADANGVYVTTNARWELNFLPL